MEEAMAECTAAAKTDAVRAFAKQFGSESEHQFRADEVDRLVEQLMNTGFDDARTRRLLDGMEFESKEVKKTAKDALLKVQADKDAAGALKDSKKKKKKNKQKLHYMS